MPKNPLSCLPDLQFACRETRNSLRYQWDNATRHAEGAIVIQRTASGSCEFHTPARSWIVSTGCAMIFQHGENSRYGLSAACTLPYVPEYVMIRPAGGTLEMLQALRDAYGPVLRMAEQGEACRLLHRVIDAFAAQQPADRLERAETVYRILLALLREQRQETRHSDPVAYGRHLLETRFQEPRNLKEWCQEIGLSREHFTRAFRERYQTTPATFLRTLRLRHARQLLLSTHLPQEDIAQQSGFLSVQTFHRAYRAHYQTPPGRRDPSAPGNR